MAKRIRRGVETHQLLTKNELDLEDSFAICRPGFELDFWLTNIKPIILIIRDFKTSRASPYRCRLEAEAVVKKIERFKGIYGVVKIAYKILKEVRDLFRGYELEEKPANPRGLFDLCVRKIQKHPELESVVYKSNCMLCKKITFSYEKFFNLFLIFDLKSYLVHLKNKVEKKFCERVEFPLKK